MLTREQQISRVFTKDPPDEKLKNRLLRDFWNYSSSRFEACMSNGEKGALKGLPEYMAARHEGMKFSGIEIYSCLYMSAVNLHGAFSENYALAIIMLDDCIEYAMEHELPLHVASQHEKFYAGYTEEFCNCRDVAALLGIDYLTQDAIMYFGCPCGLTQYLCVPHNYTFDAYDVAMTLYDVIHGNDGSTIAEKEAPLFGDMWKIKYPGTSVPDYNKVIQTLCINRICYKCNDKDNGLNAETKFSDAAAAYYYITKPAAPVSKMQL